MTAGKRRVYKGARLDSTGRQHHCTQIRAASNSVSKRASMHVSDSEQLSRSAVKWQRRSKSVLRACIPHDCQWLCTLLFDASVQNGWGQCCCTAGNCSSWSSTCSPILLAISLSVVATASRGRQQAGLGVERGLRDESTSTPKSRPAIRIGTGWPLLPPQYAATSEYELQPEPGDRAHGRGGGAPTR
eukprot:4391662-Pleurochrysis_carterae.AAC.1